MFHFHPQNNGNELLLKTSMASSSIRGSIFRIPPCHFMWLWYDIEIFMTSTFISLVQYPEAVELYREVLRSVESHKDKFRTDELQLLHTLHNLAEVLALKPEGIDPTLRDDQLSTQVRDSAHD